MIDNSKEYIACSAIHYDNHVHYKHQDKYGIKSGFVLCGFRHPCIIAVLPTNNYIKNLTEYTKNFSVEWNEGKYDTDGNPNPDLLNYDVIQGFMTSFGRFVDRREAAIIALNCGQITKLNYSDTKLYSEDIFP